MAIGLVETTSLVTMINDGAGSFSAPRSWQAGWGGTSSYSVLSGDVDGDGILDLCSTTDSDQKVFLGNGDGTFQAALRSDDNFLGISLTDLDGDGRADLIGRSGAVAKVSFGQADGTFRSAVTYTASAGTGEVLTGDVTGDGVTDIVSFNYTDRTLSTFVGNSKPGMAAVNLKTAKTSRSALEYMRAVQEQVTDQRGEIGAALSRLDVAKSVLAVRVSTLQAADSRIRDADIAAESAALVTGNILQQSAAAVLAQANIQPRLALMLLGS